MKITTGKLKNKILFTPKGMDVRPTQNLVRKAVFDILGQDFTGVSFLELFSGSGAVGLEAFSRGAREVTLVDHDPLCIKTMEKNLESISYSVPDFDRESIQILGTDVFIALSQLAEDKRKFDVVFIDPPYHEDLAKKALKQLNGYDILHPDSIIVVEHHKREILPEKEGRFFAIKRKWYGSTVLTVYKEA
ncbi:MAG: 16S rRNA (guanine(966)-N(2))-methyltransferase RsmD [Omnitrophica WOR_2 bacterium GWA2_47_8]|nr:MAG: 16S rRNA (guanine(966)-N(2))-methyltransferase RsmD [Omnitrophica WOR_2 bacterium GWA2_47_8]